FGIGDDTVELIAMEDEQSLAVGRFVNCLADHLNTGKLALAIIAQELVVISGNVDDARALIDLAQDFAHDRRLRGRPVPAPLQLPTVDDVADEKKRVACVAREKVREQFGLAAARPEMSVGDENRSMVALGDALRMRRKARTRWAAPTPSRLNARRLVCVWGP